MPVIIVRLQQMSLPAYFRKIFADDSSGTADQFLFFFVFKSSDVRARYLPDHPVHQLTVVKLSREQMPSGGKVAQQLSWIRLP